MTQIFQALTTGVIPGSPKPSVATGAASNSEGFGAHLESLAEELGLDLAELSPEMLEALQQWLLGGMNLPPEGARPQLGGQPLPPGGGFAQALAQSAEALHAPDDGTEQIEGLFGKTLVKDVVLTKTPLAESVLSALQGVEGEDPLIALNPGSVGAVGALRGPQSFSPVLASNLLSMSIPQPVGASGWNQAVGERLLWMVKGDQQFAELKITPPNLGPMEVKLTINNDQASVAFLSNHAAVRDALEAAIPRLREMLAQESLELVNVDVGAQQQQAEAEGREGAGGNLGRPGIPGDDDAGPIAGESSAIKQSGLGLVDLFV